MKGRPGYVRSIVAALVILVTLLGAALVAASPGPHGDDPVPVSIERDRVQVGDVIATGVRRADGKCEFGRIEITTTVPYEEHSDHGFQWIGFRLDPDRCQAVISAKWSGLIDHGPEDVIAPVRKYLSESVDSIPETPLPPRLAVDRDVDLLAPPGRKTSEQHVFSYGYGGQGDKLTHKYGGITFYWDPYNNAFLDDKWGSCAAATWTSGLGWEWRVDSCRETSVQAQGWEVWREGTGDYHCHDLPGGMNPCGGATGYHHSLIDLEKGRADGSSICLFGHTGSVVQGPAREILQGCS